MSATALVLATALTLSPTAPAPTYFLGGTDASGTATVTEADISWLLDGDLTGARNVPYPRSSTNMDASVDIGAAAIVDILDNADGPVRIAGVSQGALAIAAAKATIMARSEEDRPDADDVVFVAIADPSSSTGIATRFEGLHVPSLDVTLRTAPETPYDTIVVAAEYDGLADFPDRPWNLLATLNAVAGGFYLHSSSYGPDADLDAVPAGNITETVNSLGGTTTTYLLESEHLPLLQPLRDLKVDEQVVAAIEEPLKQIVDAGYSRNDPAATEADTGLQVRDRREQRKAESEQTEKRTRPRDHTEKPTTRPRVEKDRAGKGRADRDAA